MTKGIYCYHDNLRCEIIYVGKDSHIDENRRYKQHYYPSRRGAQEINKVLQNDNKSGRYSYAVLEQGDFTEDELNQKEISWISFFNPKFCFTEGGEGVLGYKHTEEARKKIRENNPDRSGENNPMHGVHRYGEKNPNARYQNAFWDINNVKYDKSTMFKDGNSNGLNPRRCFKLRYKGNILKIGNFHEWISVEIITQKINKYQGDKDGR